MKHLQGGEFRARVQRFGGYLAGMIMPNIGAFIAWGLITALFIPTGWLPNATLGKLVDPMITYLLPLLIGYTGGHMVHGRRGAVIGAVATIGVVVGADVPMFLGAMIWGPAAAFLLKMFDNAVHGKIKAGFEMLVANFSLGIIGGIMAIIGVLGVGPIVSALTAAAGNGVNFLVSSGLLPLVSIIVEPAKVLFSTTPSTTACCPRSASSKRRSPGSRSCSWSRPPRPRVRHPGRLPGVRSAAAAPVRARRDDRAVPRRHPRDLLPVHPHEATPDPGRHLRWGLRPGHRADLPGRSGRAAPPRAASSPSSP